MKNFFFALHLILGKKSDWFWVEQFLIQIFVLLKFFEVPGPPLFKILRTLLAASYRLWYKNCNFKSWVNLRGSLRPLPPNNSKSYSNSCGCWLQGFVKFRFPRKTKTYALQGTKWAWYWLSIVKIDVIISNAG